MGGRQKGLFQGKGWAGDLSRGWQRVTEESERLGQNLILCQILTLPPGQVAHHHSGLLRLALPLEVAHKPIVAAATLPWRRG